jgi:hypothetical protein
MHAPDAVNIKRGKKSKINLELVDESQIEPRTRNPRNLHSQLMNPGLIRTLVGVPKQGFADVAGIRDRLREKGLGVSFGLKYCGLFLCGPRKISLKRTCSPGVEAYLLRGAPNSPLLPRRQWRPAVDRQQRRRPRRLGDLRRRR